MTLPLGSTNSSRKRLKASAAASTWPSAPCILVASTLIINSFDGCHAAPRPVQTTNYSSAAKKRHDARAAFADVDDAISVESDYVKKGGDVTLMRRQEGFGMLWKERDTVSTTTATPSRHTYAVSTGSGRNIIVPSAYASSIASSWDPRHRSVWFQRKAVIITSIFLAIFIVLIIGAAAFIRDKREADAEGEIDISDEAALKRMKEEREMRAGKKKSKKTKEEREGDDTSLKKGGVGVRGKSTGIVLRWVKMPSKRLRKRKGKLSLSQSSQSTESITYQDTPSPRNESANNSQSLEIADSSGLQASRDSGEVQRSTSVQSGENSSLPSTNQVSLSVGDLTAAEAEAERQLQSGMDEQAADAFPPAYISGSRDYLHPSARRTLLAGSSSSRATMETSSDEKRRLADDSTNDLNHDDEALPSLPTIAESRPSDGQYHYSGHIATDDKTLLGQLHHAASTPSASGPASSDLSLSNESSSLQSGQASAPLMEASAPEFDLTEEELNQTESRQATFHGKGKSPLSMLPAPPKPLSSSTFSRFDMPYTLEATSMDMVGSPRVLTEAKLTSSQKDIEAEEERLKALAIVESKPEDMAHLPKYESRQDSAKIVSAMPSAPDFSSAPMALADDEQPAETSIHDFKSSLPSAPPADD